MLLLIVYANLNIVLPRFEVFAKLPRGGFGVNGSVLGGAYSADGDRLGIFADDRTAY